VSCKFVNHKFVSKKLIVLPILCVVLGATGCTAVQPWERGELARAEMKWDPDLMKSALRDHIYFSKEGSSGGASSGGGGCGCN